MGKSQTGICCLPLKYYGEEDIAWPICRAEAALLQLVTLCLPRQRHMPFVLNVKTRRSGFF